MSEEQPAIKVTLQVVRLQTLADGGLRFTFDASEDSIPQMAMLAECKRTGILLDASLTAHVPPVEKQEQGNYGL